MATSMSAYSTHTEVLTNLSSIRRVLESSGCAQPGKIIESDDLQTARSLTGTNKSIQVLATCIAARNRARNMINEAKSMIEKTQQQAELADDNQHQTTYQEIQTKALTLSKNMADLTLKIRDLDQQVIKHTVHAITHLIEQHQASWLPTILEAVPTLSNDHKALLEELAGSMDPRPIVDQLLERGIAIPATKDYWLLMATLAISLSKGVLT